MSCSEHSLLCFEHFLLWTQSSLLCSEHGDVPLLPVVFSAHWRRPGGGGRSNDQRLHRKFTLRSLHTARELSLDQACNPHCSSYASRSGVNPHTARLTLLDQAHSLHWSSRECRSYYRDAVWRGGSRPDLLVARCPLTVTRLVRAEPGRSLVLWLSFHRCRHCHGCQPYVGRFYIGCIRLVHILQHFAKVQYGLFFSFDWHRKLILV